MPVDGKARPLNFLPTPGQSSDQKGFAPLVDGLEVRSGKRGKPRSRPRKIVADTAYLARSNRRLLRSRCIGCVIPRARNHRRRGPFDKAAYRQRNQVEHSLAIVTLAATVIWLRELA